MSQGFIKFFNFNGEGGGDLFKGTFLQSNTVFKKSIKIMKMPTDRLIDQPDFFGLNDANRTYL